MIETEARLHESFEPLSTGISLVSSKSVYTRISMNPYTSNQACILIHSIRRCRTGPHIADISGSKRIRQENIICLLGSRY